MESSSHGALLLAVVPRAKQQCDSQTSHPTTAATMNTAPAAAAQAAPGRPSSRVVRLDRDRFERHASTQHEGEVTGEQ